MKKLLFILAIIAMTTPMMAQSVDFVLTDLGSLQVQIGYANNGVPAADLPVGIALKVVCTDCEVTGLVDFDNTEFPAYIDFAYSEETAGDGYDPLGEGQPLAKEENIPGRLDTGVDLPATTVYVCMGRVQDAVAGPNPGPEAVVNLVTLQLALTGGDATVTVSEDLSSRGGVVGGGDPFATNLPVVLPLSDECFPSDDPAYDEWVSVGKPECWCYVRQCHGDADGLKTGSAFLGYTYVSVPDLNILASAYLVKDPTKGPGLSGNQICADFDHSKTGSAFLGYTRVSVPDLNILAAYYLVKEQTKGTGTPADCPGDLDPSAAP
jgi:hypothetical protein